MPELKFILTGNHSDLVATQLVRALGPEGNKARRQRVTEASDADRKIVDPISLAACPSHQPCLQSSISPIN
jgi:hypothetical protein